MPGKVDRLMADPLLETAVAGDHVGMVVDEACAEAGGQHALRERHADRGGDALAERPGRRLDTQRMAVFRMPGSAAAELAEPLQLLDRHVGIAEQMVDSVEQHGPVSRRQDEAVAVRPAGRGRIDADEAVEEHGRHVGHAHRHAGMTGIRLLHGVHRQCADGVGHPRLNGTGGREHCRPNVHECLPRSAAGGVR